MASQQHKYSQAGAPIKIWSWFQIFGHVVRGLAILFLQFPFIPQQSKDIHIKNWSRKLLEIFGFQLKVKNSEILPSKPFLLVANHISWMDIHAINSFSPIRFVAKSEVEEWPIFGWMAKQLGTIFIKRNNARHARQIAGDIALVLNAQSVCIFPEGTSTDGEAVLPFKPNLFEAAIIANAPVYSLAISYKSAISGMRNIAPAFIGEMGLLESMSNILNSSNLLVELSFLPPPESVTALGRDRKWLALQSQEAISNHLSDR